jgi:hypothetical protein
LLNCRTQQQRTALNDSIKKSRKKLREKERKRERETEREREREEEGEREIPFYDLQVKLRSKQTVYV